jgi:uncharacterized Zn finger protein
MSDQSDGSQWRGKGWYPPSKPRPVEGGLKARTGRGAIGSTWWSQRFVAVLESFAMGGRLDRGRAYARKGQVISLEVTAGAVRARVQGSRAKPYQVAIELTPFPGPVWAKAEIALSEQALASAKLLAGKVPPELEEIFAEAGAPLFPGAAGELKQSCSCPDWGVPCKHLAATFYLLAESFDEDPFLILHWRGREREPLLARLRELRSGEETGPPLQSVGAASATPPSAAGAALALAGLAGPQVGDPHQFWLPPAPLPPRPPVLETDATLLLRQLPVPPSLLGGEQLIERLRPSYERLGETS